MNEISCPDHSLSLRSMYTAGKLTFMEESCPKSIKIHSLFVINPTTRAPKLPPSVDRSTIAVEIFNRSNHMCDGFEPVIYRAIEINKIRPFPTILFYSTHFHSSTIVLRTIVFSTRTDSASMRSLEEALGLAKTALELSTNACEPGHFTMLEAIQGLDLCLRHLGSLAEAATMFEQCWKIRKELLSSEHLDTLGAMSDLALTYRLLGKSSEDKEMETISKYM
jgi:Tetratricopeptide repeat